MAASAPETIRARDAADPLAPLRDRFHLPEGLVYLDGNSLGPAPKAVFAELERAARDEWGEGLIESWNGAGWFALPRTLGDRLGLLLGAAPGQVVVCDTVSVDLYKCLAAALALRPERPAIVAEGHGFPTDIYIAEGLRRERPGLALRLQGRDGATLEELIDDGTAVVLVNHVDYRSGELRDMAAVTRVAHDRGALVVWDLCHSAGVMPVGLDGHGVDFAVGCTYKYLNGGPGAPAFIYAARRHHGRLVQPLAGWWSHADPFAFEPRHVAAPDIAAMLTGTQPILSMRALGPALDAFEGVDLTLVRAKSRALTELFIELVEERCAGHGLDLAVPRDAARRGSHVAFRHPHGHAVVQALAARGVVGDFRAPDLMRFGFAPLYLRFADVWSAVDILREILDGGVWRDPAYARRSGVT